MVRAVSNHPSQALRITPPTALPKSYQTTSAPSAPGIPDTLRQKLSLTTPAPTSTNNKAPITLSSTHPLEARLAQWRATQDSLKMEGLRRAYGIAEPVRRGMELRIAGAGEWRPLCLGGSAGVHSDVLNGREAEIAWEDVFTGDELREVPDFHSEVEARMKMNW
ncbi:proteasome maturation factor UMP1 [Trichodelitschia bisporula]|uniref:Proteasome maturation factor UMP1 n=1 Tax=Trichodelitschia bisporula TaxID=703511 RepID=A0A6G1HYP4_9PEZI|nr:proteasome maturation factor UMP1 [Trichodelitschia bisporula]